jgi:hypothetical protein
VEEADELHWHRRNDQRFLRQGPKPGRLEGELGLWRPWHASSLAPFMCDYEQAEGH